MLIKSFLLILQRQITQKWGRFLLSSGGIMIGVWAITLTSSLSFGLSDTIVTAINSQAVAKEIRVYQTPDKKTKFEQVQGAPTFVPIKYKEITELKNSIPNIVGSVPSELIGFYLPMNDVKSCIELNTLSRQSKTATPEEIAKFTANLTAEQKAEILKNIEDFSKICPSITFPSNVFSYFYDINKTNWLGKTEALGKNEIAVCFKCGSMEFGKMLKANEPKELLNKEIKLEFKQAPNSLEAGVPQSVLDFETNTSISTSKVETFKIVAVIDDRENNAVSPTGGSLNFYVDFSHFQEAIRLKSPDLPLDSVGFIENVVYVDSYENVDKVVNSLRDKGYLAVSLTQFLISGIKVIFQVLTWVLALFGLIAMVASVFGIINVITISVLERKKEIGVLKSLGAMDRDIFSIFLLESMFMGFLGWLLGTLLALGFGLAISLGFNLIVANNADWKSNLDNLGITNFAPTFPWWLVLGTLAISLFFTILSGVYPALKASKQNPVEVLRSE